MGPLKMPRKQMAKKDLARLARRSLQRSTRTPDLWNIKWRPTTVRTPGDHGVFSVLAESWKVDRVPFDISAGNFFSRRKNIASLSLFIFFAQFRFGDAIKLPWSFTLALNKLDIRRICAFETRPKYWQLRLQIPAVAIEWGPRSSRQSRREV